MVKKERNTLETQIKLELSTESFDGKIDTGVGFLNHMLTLFSFHSGLSLSVMANGDTDVDDHHTVEDIGILLGESIREIYQDIASYTRYGLCYLPMDESLARVVVDLSGRPFLSFDADISTEKVGNFDTELVQEFFNAVAMNSKMTLHIDLLKAGNSHHEIEAIFKGFGRALSMALEPKEGGTPSSKGVIS